MSDRLTKLLAEAAGEQVDRIAALEAEVSRLTRALEEARKDARDWQAIAEAHLDTLHSHAALLDHHKARADKAEAEVARLRGQVEGAWRVALEEAAQIAGEPSAFVEDKDQIRERLAKVARIRALPPPSAPADDTDTNHKET